MHAIPQIAPLPIFYRPQGGEVALFEHAFHNRLPMMINLFSSVDLDRTGATSTRERVYGTRGGSPNG